MPATPQFSKKPARVVFLQRGIYESLGIMHLSSFLKKNGHQVLLLIESLEGDMFGRLKDFKPDLACFGTITGSHLWAYETARKIKAEFPGVLTVMGGPHATFFPEAALHKGFDALCLGEGEEALMDLAGAIHDKEKIKTLRNIWLEADGRVFRNEVRPLAENLDSLPFPDRELYYRYPELRKAGRKTFLTTRGCPYNCSFCFNHKFRELYQGKGPEIRRRSAGNIISEILEVKEKYGLDSVFIQDDTFILDKPWLLDFLEKYKERVHLPFTCLVRADLTDEEIVRALAAAQCAVAQFGIESGVERLRNKVLRKGLTDEQIVKAAALYKKYGIKFKTYNMLGLPGENLEDAFKTVELNAGIKTDLPWASVLLPYPGTDIAVSMRERGLLPDGYSVDDVGGSFFGGKAGSRREKDMLNLQRLFFWAVRFPRLFPLIKKLIKLPPNYVFDGLYYAAQFYVYKVSENLDWATSFKMGFNFVSLNLKKRAGRAGT